MITKTPSAERDQDASAANPANAAARLLDDILKLVEERPLLDDLTPTDREAYIDELAKLNEAVQILLQPDQILTGRDRHFIIIASIIYHAHNIGTYKVPFRKFKEKGIIDVLLMPRSVIPTPEYIEMLENLDLNFRKRRQSIKTKTMREAKAARNRKPADALMAAITRHLGTRTIDRPFKVAESILDDVNNDLVAMGFAKVSPDAIYRRLRDFPRS